MKCMQEPERRKKVEIALHQLLSSVNTPIDESSLTIYILEYLSQLADEEPTMKQSLENDLNCFLLEDTHRIVEALFECIQSVPEEEKKEEGIEEQILPENTIQQEEPEKWVPEEEYDPTIPHEENRPATEEKSPIMPVSTPRGGRKNRYSKKNGISYIQTTEIIKKMMSSDTSPLEKAQLKFELLSKTGILFRSLKVNGIPEDKMSVIPLAIHFKHYGEIINITLQESDNSAIINFATSKSAYAAMYSRSAVFNNRFVIVEPYYEPDDPSTFDTKESLAAANQDIAAKKEDQEEKMKLVEEQNSIKNQQIEKLEKSIQKRLELLSKYATFAKTVKDQEKVQLKISLDKVLIPLYEEAESLYELFLKAGKTSSKDVDCTERIKNYLYAIVSAFENTYLYTTLQEDVTNQLVTIFNKQLSMVRHTSGKGYHSHKKTSYKQKYYDTAMYQIDNRSKEIVINNLPDGCKEADIAYSLKGYFGVQNIRIDGNQAFVSFEQYWHTKKPIKSGLYIQNQIMYPQLVTSNH